MKNVLIATSSGAATRGVAKRSVFVIDREGIVRYRWVTDDALVLPDFDAAIAVLRQL